MTPANRSLRFLWVALLTACGPSEGQHYVYPLQAPPQMLAEELAIAKATETFTKEGRSMEKWRVYRPDSSPCKAPDGTPEKYFDRNSFRPTDGRVHFTDGKRYATVQVRLEGNRLVCFMFYGM